MQDIETHLYTKAFGTLLKALKELCCCTCLWNASFNLIEQMKESRKIKKNLRTTRDEKLNILQ